MRLSIILFLIFISVADCFCQNRNSVWCFGDSAGIDFNTGLPIAIQSIVKSRGTCTSICDKTGQLLFYAGEDDDIYTVSGPPFSNGEIFTNQHQTMQNGDSIVMTLWYNEAVITDNPAIQNQFYLFTIGVTGNYGFYYSIVDMNLNGGLGAVIQKNIQLQNFANTDCLNAIKHGNGRDWWVIFRKSGVSPGVANNEFYQYLITPSGISNVFIQSVGSINSTNGGKITFSQKGNKMVFTNLQGLIELYDYDRCSGNISNPVTIHPETVSGSFNYLYGCEFSPNGNILYVTKTYLTSYLFQFDLTAPNILATMDTLFVKGNPNECIGGLKRGPDGKIYESGGYVNPAYFPYPYPDSVYNKYNKNLGVINYPDSLGAACDFQPWSFNLGGKRTYWGLPNNPDYDLGHVTGSICDSLSVCNPPSQGLKTINITSTTAQLKWKIYPNALGYKIRYKQPGLTWKYRTVYNNNGSKVITNLVPGKKYRWAVATICAAGDTSAYSVVQTFTTAGVPHNVYNVVPDTIAELIVPYSGKEVFYENHPDFKEGEINITYIVSWEKAFINAQYLEGTTYTLIVTDVTGRQIFKEIGGLRPPYFTKDLNMAAFAKGMYIVNFVTDKERLVKKFIKD